MSNKSNQRPEANPEKDRTARRERLRSLTGRFGPRVDWLKRICFDGTTRAHECDWLSESAWRLRSRFWLIIAEEAQVCADAFAAESVDATDTNRVQEVAGNARCYYKWALDEYKNSETQAEKRAAAEKAWGGVQP